MENITRFLEHLMAISTPEKPAWNKEKDLETFEPHWNYIDGCMIKAVLGMYKATNDKKYVDFADNFIDYYVSEDGTILGYSVDELNCDHINEGKVLYDLYDYTGKEKYKKALDLLYSQVKIQPRTEGGNFWHKNIYPNQIWLDGLYMVQPFYLEYEKRYNGFEGYKDVFKQFDNVYKLMKDERTGLFFHAYDETKSMFWADAKTGLSQNFWTRSLGWYAMALVDTIDIMDEMYFYEYETLQVQLKELLDALLSVQDLDSKMFWQVTEFASREGNYLETSGTCAIAYTLMKGARLGYLPTYYYDKGKEIFDAVAASKLVERNGELVLKDICLVAGLGGMPGKGSYKLRDGTYEYYISEPIVDNDAKGVAPFYFAAAEALLHK